jgi:hypothetical protein
VEVKIRHLDGELDPHEHQGLVYNLPADQITVHLDKALQRVGNMGLWSDQAFVNHEHQLIDDDDATTEEPLLVMEIASVLRERFPHHHFVIELDPLSRVTWYQRMGEAPTEDESEWLVRKNLHCHKCGAEAVKQRCQNTDHRGIRICACPSCGWSLVHSTRVIRFIVGQTQ